MQISVRSYLTVGTAAVVGAGAIALSPVLPGVAAQPAYLPAPVTAQVNLTGLNLSLTDILGVLDKFGVLDISGLAPILNLLPTALLDAITTQFLDQAGPVLKETAGEVFKYVATAASGLFLGKDSIPNQILGALVHVPAVVAAAIGELRNGNPGGALDALASGFAAPITVIGQVLKQAVEDFSTFMQTKLGLVIGELAPVLVSVVTNVIGNQLGGGLQTVIDAIKNLFGGLLPGASVRVGALAAAPAAASVVADLTTATDGAPAAVTALVRPHTPRAAASARTAKAAAAESEAPAVSDAPEAPAASDAPEAPESTESSAPQAGTEQAAAPTRARVSLRSALADRAERVNRHSAERPHAAAARGR